MSEHKRTITEIVIDLEVKVDQVLQYLKNIDNNYKVLLNRMNTLQNVAAAPVVPQAQPNTLSVKAPEAPQVPLIPKGPVKFEDMPKTSKWDDLVKAQEQAGDLYLAEDPYELREEVKPTGQRRGQRVTKKESNQVAVSQIIHNNGKPLFLGIVEILNPEGLVKKTRTNANGRWSAALPPGSYKVQVEKSSVKSESDNVNETYLVDVPSQDRYDLEVHHIGENREVKNS